MFVLGFAGFLLGAIGSTGTGGGEMDPSLAWWLGQRATAEALESWEAELSYLQGSDGLAVELSGVVLEDRLRTGPVVDLAGGATLLLRLRATNRAWEAGIAALLAEDGTVLARVYGEDRNHGQNLELVFEAVSATGLPTHVRCPLKPLRLGAWHDLVFVCSGNALVLYAEGVRKGSVDLPGPWPEAPVARVLIGGDGTERDRFRGRLDSAYFYRRAMGEAEVLARRGRTHQEELLMAAARVAAAGPRVATDPMRPRYHLTAPVGLMGDPNGPVFFEGRHHLLYQFFPYFMDEDQMLPGWGHVVSDDGVRWERWPTAMMPVPGTYDAAACASGCCVIHEGVPTIVYTSVPPQAQSIAVSRDGMRTWEKYEGNPVVPGPPDIENLGDGFRDPFLWREDDGWYMAVGSAIAGVGGTLPLYRSTDLRNWEYLHPLCTGTDPDCKQWECPNFFPLGDRWVLIVSPLLHSSDAIRGDVIYAIGDYADHRFTPESWHTLDLGGHFNYYAPNSYVDDRGRRIVWGLIGTGPSAGFPWHGAQSLPRVFTLREDGRLGVAPVPELAALRETAWHAKDVVLDGPAVALPGAPEGCALEVLAAIDPGEAAEVGLDVRVSADGSRCVPIRFDVAGGTFRVGEREAKFSLISDETLLIIHVFVDHRIMEVYINGREVMTTQTSLGPEDQGIRLFAAGGTARCGSLDVWVLGSAWKDG